MSGRVPARLQHGVMKRDTTPRPWRKERCPCGNEHCRTFQLSAGLHYQGSGFSEADADLILRAVNAHDEAVAVLGLIVAEWESDPSSVACFDLRTVERAKRLCQELGGDRP